MNATAIALNRFGLGARSDEAAPTNPKQWLLDQFQRYEPKSAAWASVPSSAEVVPKLAQRAGMIAAVLQGGAAGTAMPGAARAAAMPRAAARRAMLGGATPAAADVDSARKMLQQESRDE